MEVRKITLSEVGQIEDQIDDLVRAKMAADQLSYRDSVLAVAREGPGLFRAKDRLLRRESKVEILGSEGGRLVSPDNFAQRRADILG